MFLSLSKWLFWLTYQSRPHPQWWTGASHSHLIFNCCHICSLLLMSVQFSCSVIPTLCDPIDFCTPGFPVHHQLPEVDSNSSPLSWWCHPTSSSSVVPFSSCLQSFPASGSFPVSQFFTSGGQSTGASASASVLPMNIQGWFPLGLTGWISLQSKGLSRVFSFFIYIYFF